MKKSTWTQIKAFLKTYFDTLYPADSTVFHKATASEITGLTEQTTPASGDVILAEKSSDGSKIKIQFSKFVNGSGVLSGILQSDVDTDPQLTLKDHSAHVIGMFQYGTTSGVPASFSNINSSSNFICARIFNKVLNDIAEHFETDGSVQAGELSMLDVNSGKVQLTKYDITKFDQFMGIISTAPGIHLGANPSYDEKTSKWLALKGQVPLKIENANQLYVKGQRLFLIRDVGLSTINEVKRLNLSPLDYKELGIIVEVKTNSVRLFI
jgi:hypothetical protein